jgi:hypothetical protein
LDYPQKLTIELIEVLEVTFAPFVYPEKPQVFPAPAASFISKDRVVCTSDTAAVGFLPPMDEARAYDPRPNTPVYIIFFDYPAAIGRRQSPIRASLSRAPLVTRQCRTCSRHAAMAVPIWLDASQFCNSHFAGFDPQDTK